MRVAKQIGIGILCALISKIGFTQQLRLGKNPYAVEKSAVLELMSDNQGLLLPRITDTSLINTLSPPDGMIIYYSPSKQLLVRSNSLWKVMAETGTVVTSLNGNTGALTMDTGYISNFYLKVRALHSVSAPLTYNSSTGAIAITQATTSTNGYLSSTDWNTFNNKSAALTFSTGLTNSSNTITNDLSTGIAAANQNIYGSTSASGTLTLNSTSHATKGKILFGSSAYDEVNNKLNIGTTTSQQRLTIGGVAQEAISRDIRTGSLEIMGGISEATGAYFQITGDQNTNSPYEGSAEFVIRNLTNSQFALFSYDGASTWTQRFQLKGTSGDTYLTPNGGKVSIGGITPTANLHLKAGTATANTAPLKFTAGTNLTTPENGALEYNGTNLFITNAGVRETILTSASTFDTTNISSFYLKVRSLLSGGTGISYNNSTGVITNSGVTSLNGNTGSLTMDTTYISNFYLKVRALHSVSAPLTYNSSTGAIAITQATTSTNGYLSSTDWNTFNNKLSSIDTSNISSFYLKVRSLLSGGTGISYNNSTGVITNSGVTSLNGNTGALTMDTTYISNFYLKVRALHSVSAPITYNSSTGAIAITQATTSTNGYLSSTDWNNFNDKAETASPAFTGITTINSLNLGVQSIATSGGTTTLTSASPYYTVFTGSSTQSIVLPNATTLSVGQVYVIENNSTGAVTTKTNGGATLWIIATTAELRVILIANGTAAGTWQVDYLGGNYASGKLFTVNNTLTFNGTDGTTMTLPTTSKTIAANDGSNLTISGQAIGDIPIASSTTAYGKLADVATGSVLISGGVGVAPSWSTSIPSTTTATTQAASTNNTTIATTAFVKTVAQPMNSTFTTLTPGTTVTFTPAVGTNVYTLIPAQNETLNMGTVPAACVGQLINLIITTSGTTSYTITFGTNIRDQVSTLITGTVTAKKFVVQYLIESTTSVLEVSRTTAL